MEISILLTWVAIVIVGWLWIRKNKPHFIGLGENRNKQKLDRIKFEKCSKCYTGTLDPIFRWWQYALLISTPFGFVLLGSPLHYICNSCKTIDSSESKVKLFTRLSLSHKLTKPFFVGLLVNIVLALSLAYIFIWSKKI